MNEIVLNGCTTEPLMGYMKAMGVFRIVSGQVDLNVKGFWRDGVFILMTQLNELELTRFCFHQYRPTPVIVPWSGGNFFDVREHPTTSVCLKHPTGSQIIEAFLETRSERLAEYRKAIRDALVTLSRCGISNKEDMGKKEAKRRYIAMLRSVVDDSVVDWIDCCAILTSEKVVLNTLLGSGGGSDGRAHFSDNFMQNLMDVLPDFDHQRKQLLDCNSSLLHHALFATNTSDLIPNRTSSLYDAGSVGGANAGHGFERVSLANPWNFVLCMEGVIAFAGAVSKRQAAERQNQAVFPFQVKLTTTSLDASVEKETSEKEIWLPVWEKPARYSEILGMLSEGRASVGTRSAKSGLDFARAAAGLGVDRGIRMFHRYAIVKGRIGGENYNTSTLLGRFEVQERPQIRLVCEIDNWLEHFRSAISDTNTPARFRRALHRIESAIFGFCQYGGVHHFSEILCALGKAEYELAQGMAFRNQKDVQPIAGLSPEWLEAANDGSVEFDIALALSGINDAEHRIGSIRENLEPVALSSSRKESLLATWQEDNLSAVWNSSDPIWNMAAVLERRFLDAKRAGCNLLPIAYRRAASIGAVAAFLAGETDDRRITELLWGMVLIDHRKPYPPLKRFAAKTKPLWRSYALMKLLFLPAPLSKDSDDVVIKPEAAILPLLRANRPAEACQIAIRRLRASGLRPMSSNASAKLDWSVPDPMRLAAALLIPVSKYDIDRLKSLVIRSDQTTESLAA